MLLQILSRYGLSWFMDHVALPSKVKQLPVNHLRITLSDDSMNPPVKAVHVVPLYLASADLDTLLEQALREHLPGHPAYRAWLDTQGEQPVVLTDMHIEHASVAIHAAMRKVGQSPQSALNWNAQHHLSHHDWSVLMSAVRQRLREVRQEALPALPRRRSLGYALRDTFVSRSHDLLHESPTGDEGRPVERTELQLFALQTFYLTCKSTEDSEFVWAWTAYLCDDAAQAVAVGH